MFSDLLRRFFAFVLNTGEAKRANHTENSRPSCTDDPPNDPLDPPNDPPNGPLDLPNEGSAL